MNDHELDLALGAMGQQRTAVPDLPELHDIVRSVSTTPAKQHGLLPRPLWRFRSMFSAIKFVVAGAIVALFGGFLLAGLLAQPPSEGPLPPAAASASASPDAARLEAPAIEWTRVPLDDATFGNVARMNDIATNGSLVAIGGARAGSAAVWTSPDGLTWERVPHDPAVFGGKSRNLNAPATVIDVISPWQGGFVAAGKELVSDLQRLPTFWRSDDGRTWTRVQREETPSDDPDWHDFVDIATTGDMLTAIGRVTSPGDREGADGATTVWSSTDGTTWERQDFSDGTMRSITATPDGFIAVGDHVWSSTNGRDWDRIATPEGSMQAVAATEDGYVASGVGEAGLVVWFSADARSWEPAWVERADGGPADRYTSSMTSGDGGLVAVVKRFGAGSFALGSHDGRSWERTDGGLLGLAGITAFRDGFVGVGSGWAQGPGAAGLYVITPEAVAGSEW